MHKNIVLCFMVLIYMPLVSMEQTKDIWTIIVASSETTTKNTLRSVCPTLKKISSKNNCQLYLCNNLVLSATQKEYALGFAMYKNLNVVIENLCKHIDNAKTLTWFDQPIINLSLYNNIYRQKHDFNTSPPHYLVAATFGDIGYMQTYCQNRDNDITATTVRNFNVLLLAVKYGHTHIVRLLLKHPQISTLINTKNSYGKTPLWLAAYFGYLSIVTLLCNHNAIDFDIQNDTDNVTPLYAAAGKGHTSIIKLLLTHSPSHINHATNSASDTPLLAAAESGHLKTVQLLCQQGTNLNHQNKWGTTALYLATQNNHISVIRFFLKQKTIDTRIGYQRYTPLHAAAQNNHTRIIHLLLKHSPDLINMHNNDNSETALYIAVTYQKYEAAKILLKANGVDVNIVNKNNQTPRDIAISKNDTAMIELLQKYGAKTASEISGNFTLDEHCTIS